MGKANINPTSQPITLCTYGKLSCKKGKSQPQKASMDNKKTYLLRSKSKRRGHLQLRALQSCSWKVESPSFKFIQFVDRSWSQSNQQQLLIALYKHRRIHLMNLFNLKRTSSKRLIRRPRHFFPSQFSIETFRSSSQNRVTLWNILWQAALSSWRLIKRNSRLSRL